jgi:dihydroxy-acid dehydratase
MADAAIAGPGVCAGMGTANSMHIVAEALGMAIAGSAPVRATGDRMNELARAAGRRIVELIEQDVRPRQIITEESIRNAVAVAIAMGCSVNVVRHLSAVAVEAEIDMDVVACFEESSSRVPLLCSVRPNGPHRTEDLEAAGGARAVMRELGTAHLKNAMTVTGAGLVDGAAGAPAADGDVVHPLSAPAAQFGGLSILRGSLAPDGAIIKVSAVGHGRRAMVGNARVFDSERSAMAALSAGGIREGDIVVLRGLGPRGGPGTVFAAGFVAALVGAGLSGKVGVVTDGELSGLNRGLTVGQVMPEAAAGGPLAVVEEGDEISIDLDAKSVDLVIPAEELDGRLASLDQPAAVSPPGWLRIYGRLVGPIAKGATLVPRDEGQPRVTFREMQ